MIKRFILPAITFLILLVLLTLFITDKGTEALNDPLEQNKSFNFSILGEPYNTDPIEYDYGAHHDAFSAVTSTIVTTSSIGGATGILAESWSTSDDLSIWKFVIREGMTFENGKVITPTVILKSLLRLKSQYDKRDSKSNIFQDLTTDSNNSQGIFVDGNKLIFTFNAPQKSLIEYLSFGEYGIIDVDDTNEDNSWKEKKKINASGPYKIASWDENGIKLMLREEFPRELRHPNAFKEISLTWEGGNEYSGDLFRASQKKEIEDLDTHKFFGNIASSIAYLRFFSWNHPKSPFYDKKERIKLRNLLHLRIREEGLECISSFFPIGVPGIVEAMIEKDYKPVPRTDRVAINVRAVKSASKKLVKYFNIIDKTSNELNYEYTSLDVSTEVVRPLKNPDLDAYPVDLMFAGTGMNIASPDDTIRYMINSKEGIIIPDPTGKLKELVSHKKLDYQAINNQIWEDAIFIPISHVRQGLYARKGIIDLSKFNIGQPSMDFSWMGSK